MSSEAVGRRPASEPAVPERAAWTPWAGLVVRLVVGTVWLVAGGLKLTHPDASVAAVRAYQLLPASLAETVGTVLPAVEIALGLALVLGVAVRVAGVVSGVLLVAFLLGIASVWARGIEIDCGCFGGGGSRAGAASSYPWEMARDTALLAGSVALIAMRRTRLALQALLFPPPPVHAPEHAPVEGAAS